MTSLKVFGVLNLAALLLCTIVVVLGAYVRLTDAGLGCPDWPTCYGHMTAGGARDNPDASNAAFPERPLHYGKALREMTHRYAASTLGLIVVMMTALAWLNRGSGLFPVRLTSILLITVIAQGALGMLTVTWLLKPLIVTLHLLGGMTTLALLWWLWLRPEQRPVHVPTPALRTFAVVGLAVLVLQIALGGWTSSNYAAVACPDFPTCQGSWWPNAQFDQAFILWRGLGIDYEGGVLDHPARVAVHLTHRLGALVTTIVLASLALLSIRRGARKPRLAGFAVLAALGLQVVIGITTVVRGFPLLWATAHNAGAALLLLGVVALIRYLWPAHAQPREQ
jgi:cytochrome c oxidase assembly protein subunit 15